MSPQTTKDRPGLLSIHSDELSHRPAMLGDDNPLMGVVYQIHQLQALSLKSSCRNVHVAASQSDRHRSHRDGTEYHVVTMVILSWSYPTVKPKQPGPFGRRPPASRQLFLELGLTLFHGGKALDHGRQHDQRRK